MIAVHWRQLNRIAEVAVVAAHGGAVSIQWCNWSEADGGPVWVIGSYADDRDPVFAVVISAFADADDDEPTAATVVSTHADRPTAIAAAALLVTHGARDIETGRPNTGADALLVTDEDGAACPECERSHGPHYRGPCTHTAAAVDAIIVFAERIARLTDDPSPEDREILEALIHEARRLTGIGGGR